MEPVSNPVPRHIAIIMDGNRRFAKRLMLKPWKGHEWGAQKLEHVLQWCKEFGVQELTLYAFSIQNFDRPKEEFNYIMNVFEENALNLLKDERVNNEGIRINFIGKLNLFPKHIQHLGKELMEKTKNNSNFTLNIAMGYGGREEVLEATYRIAKEVKEGKIDLNTLNEEVFEKGLYNKSQPDLVIRTGGDKRTSNFLIWQSAYSEWIFYEKKLWPEFEKEDFLACIEEYKHRHRRFGK
jgi:tritrans,polycis-undecaprenyl-diphosphate synthase [geranylgeranyl-diphosphate specific]